jgi:hypothetical protein
VNWPLQSPVFRKILTQNNLDLFCDYKFSDEFIHVWVNIVEHTKRMINNTAFWNVDLQCYNLAEIYQYLKEPAAFYQAT